MDSFEYSITTQVIGKDDGSKTYEVRKKMDFEGKRAVVIALYPAVSLLSPTMVDSSTLYLLNHAKELGYNEFRIVNLYSKVCKGKPSVKQLTEDEDNTDYILSVFDEEKASDTDIVIAWGSSLKLNEVTKRIKVKILSKLVEVIQDRSRVRQLAAEDLTTESLLTPHVLWMGLHCVNAWYTEQVSIEVLLNSVGVSFVEKEKKSKRSKKEPVSDK